jgi:Protein of unknown function (DUF2442)
LGRKHARSLLSFDDDRSPEFHDMADLSSMIARGGVFERLKDPNIFLSVEIGPDCRALIWRIGKDENDVIVVSADGLWLMKRPVDF